MEQHTPGPWKAVPNDRPADYELHSDIYADGLHLASVWKASWAKPGPDDDRLLPIPGAEANARLIAAAPQMLKALRAAESHLAEMLEDKRWHPRGFCPVLDTVRETIAQAIEEG